MPPAHRQKAGSSLRYSVKLDKFAKKKWLQAHEAVMQGLAPAERKSISGKQARELAQMWLESSKEGKSSVAANGVNLGVLESPGYANAWMG